MLELAGRHGDRIENGRMGRPLRVKPIARKRLETGGCGGGGGRHLTSILFQIVPSGRSGRCVMGSQLGGRMGGVPGAVREKALRQSHSQERVIGPVLLLLLLLAPQLVMAGPNSGVLQISIGQTGQSVE